MSAAGQLLNADCVRCREEARDALPSDAPFWLQFVGGMILCPICGNKRCPRASDHRLACTDSNEPGQLGSVYARTFYRRETPTPHEER